MSEPLTMSVEREAEIRSGQPVPLHTTIGWLLKELDAERAAHKRTQEALADKEDQLVSLRFRVAEISKEATTLQRMYDKCFKERDEARARWVLDPIHEQLRHSKEVLTKLLDWIIKHRKTHNCCVNGHLKALQCSCDSCHAAIALAERPENLASSEGSPADASPSHGGRD